MRIGVIFCSFSTPVLIRRKTRQTLKVAGEMRWFGERHTFADVAERGGGVQQHHLDARKGSLFNPFAGGTMTYLHNDAAEILLAQA